ncbi:PXA domain-containing protein [Pleurostoma richardsiae]|uniref:PXA domain-containing protein n=1 Tax=Pleurostoma richardsiae TaxID=41990 RepID=A0AA38RM47_9PEZI|nr:PXA domain-containing protein [Pleurostoma richardsiae]
MTQNAPPARAPTPRVKTPGPLGTGAVPPGAPVPSARPGDSSTPYPPASASSAEQPKPPLDAPSRRPSRQVSTDFLSDKATSVLIRRILCPQQLNDKGRATPAPIDDILPPLTSRNDVDLQLYALIAIIIRDFVQTWYSKITPDETFVAEIVQLIAHCTRALEQRLRKVDLESLLFDELPDLLDKHVQAYRAAHSPLVRPPVETSPREIYHSLCPLPYLSPVPPPDDPLTLADQDEHEVAYRQLLVQGVLAVLLPTEDLENECLTSLVGQIFSELIIVGNIAKKAAEPWLIWEGLTILAGTIQRRRSQTTERQHGIVTLPVRSRPTAGWSLQHFFWTLLQWLFLLCTLIRASIITIVTSQSLPRRTGPATGRKETATGLRDGVKSTSQPGPVKRPVLAFRVGPALSNLIEMDLRMPWLCGSLSMLQWLAIAGPGHIGGVDGFLDRLISNAIHQEVLDPAQLPPLLRTLRGVLFPNNMMGSPTLFPPTSHQELLALRRRCASALWALVPRGVGRLYFGGGGAWRPWARNDSSPRTGPRNGQAGQTLLAQQQKQERALAAAAQYELGDQGLGSAVGSKGPDPGEARDHQGAVAAAGGGGEEEEEEDSRIITEIETGVLDVFGDAYCNKHLMYGVLELVLVRLMPELAEKGVIDLWEERLS